MPSQPNPRVKPPSLQPGDTVGIVAPASYIHADALEAGCRALQNLGYKPFYLPSILERDIYFAGSLRRRVAELEEMFERDEVRAIVCARGGYGSNYLLDAIDLEKIGKHPKIFVGYSDLTCLLTYFADSAGLVVFHGPDVKHDFGREDGVDLNSWNAALNGISGWALTVNPEVKGLADGSGEGMLYGGCLSILASSLGTAYEVKTEGTILFLEDVAAKPFQIDRMLMQMKLAGKIKDVRGIIFGEMLDCVQNRDSKKDQGYTLEEIISRVIGNLGIPVAYGLQSGHVSRRNITLPIGVRASLKVRGNDVRLEILEPATSTALKTVSRLSVAHD